MIDNSRMRDIPHYLDDLVGRAPVKWTLPTGKRTEKRIGRDWRIVLRAVRDSVQQGPLSVSDLEISTLADRTTYI